MKKLLMLAALLAIGVNLYSANPSNGFADYRGEGISADGTVRDMGRKGLYTEFAGLDFKENNLGSGFGGITNGDTDVHANGHSQAAVNIFRRKGRGWSDKAQTRILLKVLEPIVIESEAEFVYLEAVAKDGLNIGDLGFRVKGDGNAYVSFKVTGNLFGLAGSKIKVRGLDTGFFPIKEADAGTNTVGHAVTLLSEVAHELEVDIYIPNVGPAGVRRGRVLAVAKYE